MGSALARLTGLELKQRPEPGGLLASYDFKTRDGQLAIVRAIGAADFQASEMVDTEIDVVHSVCHWVPRTDEKTGETFMGLRTVIICKDGTRISSSSETILDGLQMIAVVTGQQLPWEPPVRCIIRKAKSTSSGHNYLYIEPVG